jgi:hypothetical protein
VCFSLAAPIKNGRERGSRSVSEKIDVMITINVNKLASYWLLWTVLSANIREKASAEIFFNWETRLSARELKFLKSEKN